MLGGANIGKADIRPSFFSKTFEMGDDVFLPQHLLYNRYIFMELS